MKKQRHTRYDVRDDERFMTCDELRILQSCNVALSLHSRIRIMNDANNVRETTRVYDTTHAYAIRD